MWCVYGGEVWCVCVVMCECVMWCVCVCVSVVCVWCVCGVMCVSVWCGVV